LGSNQEPWSSESFKNRFPRDEFSEKFETRCIILAVFARGAKGEEGDLSVNAIIPVHVQLL
jgi:hypothetical protein